jgi:prepilin signal peptidase PulO-like enzyme (type II secretory pathway)
VDRSILERQIRPKPGATARGRAVEAITTAWRAVGAPVRGLTVAGIVLAVVLAGRWLGETLAALATGACLVVLVVAALVDAVERRLPNTLVALGVVPIVAAAVARAGEGLPGALVGAAWIGAPLLLVHLVSPAGMGFGDVKAGAALGAALGLLAAALAPLALVIGLALGAGYGVARRARSIPLGPALVAGALLALASSTP